MPGTLIWIWPLWNLLDLTPEGRGHAAIQAAKPTVAQKRHCDHRH